MSASYAVTSRALVPLVVIALISGGVFYGARAMAQRWPTARIIIIGGGIASVLGGVWLFRALPDLIPERPAPGLTVVYYGGWLVCAALGWLGICAASGAATARHND